MLWAMLTVHTMIHIMRMVYKKSTSRTATGAFQMNQFKPGNIGSQTNRLSRNSMLSLIVIIIGPIRNFSSFCCRNPKYRSCKIILRFYSSVIGRIGLLFNTWIPQAFRQRFHHLGIEGKRLKLWMSCAPEFSP